MKLGIMQPYFFPYIGYFSLIARTDQWVIFDVTQYRPKSWMNRNRILKPHKSKNWQYVTVPLSNSSIQIKTHEAEILNIKQAKEKILSQIEHYRTKAPFFREVKKIINESFDSTKSNKLVDLNTQSLKATCKYLNIPFNYLTCSKDINLPRNNFPAGQWALEISSILGASQYINPISGSDIFEEKDFTARGIKLSFLDQPQISYNCRPYDFIKHLSIIDVLMWNPIEKIRESL